jgi:hypothetical protein
MKKLLVLLTITACMTSSLVFAAEGDTTSDESSSSSTDGYVSLAFLTSTSTSVSSTVGGMLYLTVKLAMASNSDIDVQEFVEDNKSLVAVEASQGEGETLDSLAELLNVDTADRAHFNELVQLNYNTIYPDGTVSAKTVALHLQTIAEGIANKQI